MGRFKTEDLTALSAGGFAIIAGLITAGGGVAAIVLGDQANDRTDNSGDIAIGGGATAVATGLTVVTGGITAVLIKLVEIARRDDDDDGGAAALHVENDRLEALIGQLQLLQGQVNADASEIVNQVPADELV